MHAATPTFAFRRDFMTDAENEEKCFNSIQAAAELDDETEQYLLDEMSPGARSEGGAAQTG